MRLRSCTSVIGPTTMYAAAKEAGIRACLIRRGPWGHILDIPAVAAQCLFRIDSLDELPSLVAKHNAASG